MYPSFRIAANVVQYKSSSKPLPQVTFRVSTLREYPSYMDCVLLFTFCCLPFFSLDKSIFTLNAKDGNCIASLLGRMLSRSKVTEFADKSLEKKLV